MDLKSTYIPTLDGVRLTDTDDGFALPDGSLVPDARRDDIVYVRADEKAPPDTSETGWWRALGKQALEGGLVAREAASDEVSDLLAALGQAPPPGDDLEIKAGFFHDTLRQWISHDPTESTSAPLWDYDCWKADVEREQDDASSGEAGRDVYRAHLYRGEGEGPEEYRYWVELSGDGRVADSGWLSAPPDLLGAETNAFATEPLALSEDEAARLMDD